jgi:hypothetical protein
MPGDGRSSGLTHGRHSPKTGSIAWPGKEDAVRLPDFVIIGAAKAGTTSLYKVLTQHPDIFMSNPKEPEFFARDDRYEQGIDSYAALFADAQAHQVCGEASTLYSLSPLFPETAARLHAHVPKARLIYVLREPVSRAYSYYVQLVKNYQNATQDYRVHRSFEECLFPDRFPARAPREKFFAPFDSHLPDDPEVFLAGSDYLHQISAYLKHFDKSQILFLTFEDYLSDRRAVIEKVCAFLGVDPSRIDTSRDERANISQDHFNTVTRTLAIGKAKQRLGPFSALGRLLPQKLRRRLRDLVVGTRPQLESREHLPAPMQKDTAEALQRRFAADRAALETLTGLSFDAWNRS